MESKYILDTHIWVSIFHKNRTEELIDALIDNGITIVSTPSQEKELWHLLHYSDEVREMVTGRSVDYLMFLSGATMQVPSKQEFELPFDPEDNYLVDLAVQTGTTLVTDERSLKALSRPKLKTIGRAEFYEVLGW